MRREKARRDKKSGRRFFRLLMILAAALIGFHHGFSLSEEKRSRIRKLLIERREMPFRLFV